MAEPLLVKALREACESHGPRPALVSGDVALSYEDFWCQASELAAQLRDEGVENAPVMVRCSNHPSDFVAFLGVWMAGGVVASVHRTSPPEVVQALQAKAACVVMVDGLAEPADKVQRLTGKAVPQHVLQDAALVIFTSGSTGQPKGVVLSHQAFAGKLTQNQRLFQVNAETTTLLVLNNTFSFGIWVALMTLLQGGRVVTLGRFTPQDFLSLLQHEAISFLGVVPTMVRATFGTLTAAELAQARTALQQTGRLKQVVIGGESLGAALSAQLREFIAPAELFDVYGLTETSTSDFVLEPCDYAAHPDSIGKPFPGIAFRVIDGKGQPCPPGVTGELQLSTPYMMAGYLGDPELTRQCFSEEGWFRTGDLAQVDATGFVQVVGRLKELIVRGGNKITPMEVELALLKCDGVAQAMVAGMPDPIMGQRIHALLIGKPGALLRPEALRHSLLQHLDRFKLPDTYYLGDTLPTGRTGKIDRGQLQQWIATAVLQPLTD